MGKFIKDPNRILVFNSLKRLVAVFQSTNAAALAFNVKVQSIHYACTGQCISCQNYYFRHLMDDIEVTWDDLGVLTVEEYDELCGVQRRVYATKNMSRKGMKYKKKQYVAPTKKTQDEADSSESNV